MMMFKKKMKKKVLCVQERWSRVRSGTHHSLQPGDEVTEMDPSSLHSNFFSSLKRVEKRLKLERMHELTIPSSSREFPPKATRNCTSVPESESALSSPLYLLSNPIPSPNPTLQDSSEPPQEFLSPSSPQFLLSPYGNPSLTTDPPRDRSESFHESKIDDLDDIARLIRLLGLSDLEAKDQEEFEGRALNETCGGGGGGGNLCECRGGFHEKIVGVKGPKCKREEERLNGWIEHFLNCNGSERVEPLRLAHLLLGKAALNCASVQHGFRGSVEFPGTVEEFLQNDPPC